MNFFKRLLDEIFPENFTCELCGREVFDGERLCAKCNENVPRNDKETCPVCGRKTQSSALCMDCKANAPKYRRAVSALIYADGAAALVNNFKNGNAYLKNYFADLLAEKCRAFTDADSICFVPMTKKAEGKRGFNQSYLLAKELSTRLNMPVLNGALAKVKETSAQKKLNRTEREHNLKSCFKADKTVVAGKKIILVDDVMTTGATADAICNELLKKGADCVYFAAVASGEYKLHQSDGDTEAV